MQIVLTNPFAVSSQRFGRCNVCCVLCLDVDKPLVTSLKLPK